MFKKRTTWILPVAVISSVALLLAASTVKAQTPTPVDPEAGLAGVLSTTHVCDDMVKYWCFWVRYVPTDAAHWQIKKRVYKGAVDGGADSWQLWWAKDWECDGSCNFRGEWGPSGFLTNLTFDGKHAIGNPVTLQTNSIVTMRTRYTPNDGSGTNWCSPTAELFLQDGTSTTYGTGDCSSDPP